jgi:vacuolar-type H+-ATPase subunit H
VHVTPSIFEAALSSASTLGVAEPLSGLAAPLDATWLGKVAEVWDKVEAALRDAYAWGRETATSALNSAVAAAEELIRSAGRRGRDMQQALLERAQRYLSTLVRGALEQVDQTIAVGSLQLELTSVQLGQTISLSGSLKASITELVAFTGGGEITIAASYGRP